MTARTMDADAQTMRGKGAATATETAVKLLKHDIVWGALRPDTKLKMRVLKERYGIGASPMREALAQLSAHGLVDQFTQKGFRVPPLSREHLADITKSRQLIEPEAVKLAIGAGGKDWEDEIVASYYLLESEIGRRKRGPEDQREDFEARHHRFHRALIAACPLAAVKQFCDTLYVQATRYRLLLRDYNFANDVVIAEHRILMDAVLSRNKTAAARAIHAHISLTADVLLGSLAGQRVAMRLPKQKIAFEGRKTK